MSSQYSSEYYQAHKAEMNARVREYRHKNRDRMNAIQARHYEKYQLMIPQAQVAAIKRFRKAHNWTMVEFAQRCGVHTSTVGHWETGRNDVKPERFDTLFPELADELRRIKAAHNGGVV